MPNPRGRPRGRKTALTAPSRVRVARLKEEALAHRIRGLSLAKIGEQMNLSKERIWQLVTEALADIPRENAEAVRSMELDRLDEMQAGVWDNALTGDPKAIASMMAIQERRAKLTGTDAPTKSEVGGPGGASLFPHGIIVEYVITGDSDG